ncbi:hypothetical protein CcaverHIS002_0504680 [Cutaneotrichosporon cavernicola]|nr:hypothetical protein CcaverHIS002_0504680 [Cutaneotrichosporon cavernicola]BEJ00670.1 hypothetical protein CcaverHIS631_0505270 [Cutaneotrichosporon cavernicola]BEJ08437.1 hypothetical protein CcaverHIS641_0505310 [Cutaneotrichosporon cavernicola]
MPSSSGVSTPRVYGPVRPSRPLSLAAVSRPVSRHGSIVGHSRHASAVGQPSHPNPSNPNPSTSHPTSSHPNPSSTALIHRAQHEAATVFPASIANLISALATSARLSLRVSAFFIEVILEGSQYSTRVGLGYTRRVLISAISSARRVYLASNAALDGDLLAAVGLADHTGKGPSTDAFLNVLDRWTNLGIYVIHHTFTLAELFTMSGFYLTANTVQGASFAAHESVTLFDSLFGSNESSRALSSIITLVRRELLEDDRFKAAEHGKVATLTALTKALTAFACLQNATWHSTAKRFKMKVLYDCTVLTSSDESFSGAKPEPLPQIDGLDTLSRRTTRQQVPPAIEEALDADGDVNMEHVSQVAAPAPAMSRVSRTRTSRTLGPTPDTSKGADIELLLQLEGLASADEGDDDEPFGLVKPKPPLQSPDKPRRRQLKRVHTDTYEITDEFSESMVVTQTLERLGPSPIELDRPLPRSSTASIPDVLVEALDEDVEMSDQSDEFRPPATPMQTPVVEEDETDWIEVDHLLDEPSTTSASSAMVPSVPSDQSILSDEPSSNGSSDKIQLVLRTMTNKLLQHRRIVRRVKRMSPSQTPSPPPGIRKSERSGSPFASAAAEPAVAPAGATRDLGRADVRSIDWGSAPQAGPSTRRSSTPCRSPQKRRAEATPPPPPSSPEKKSGSPKGKGKAKAKAKMGRRSIAALRDATSLRAALRPKSPQPFPDREEEEGSEPINVSVRQTLRPAPIVESQPPSPTTVRGPMVPPPTPFGAPRVRGSMHGSTRTRSSRIQASSSQIFTAGQRDTAANLFPHEPLIKNIHRFMRYSSAAYGQNFLRIFGLGNADFNFPTTGRHHANSWAFAQHTNIQIDALLLSSFTESEAYSPAFAQEKAPPLVHYVAVEHALQAIVLTCRGTLGLSDVLVDLTCDYREIPVEGGDPDGAYFAHAGMYESAVKLSAKQSRVHQTLLAALEQYPSYGLVLCGHSLGGGVAALLAINSAMPAEKFMAQNATRERPVRHPRITTKFVTSFSSGLPPGRPIHCYAYGIPAVVSSDLARHSSGLITSIIQNADVVPTLSLGVLRDLRNIAVTLFEEGGVAEEIVARVTGLKRDSSDNAQADWMMSLIKTMRADMDNDKLFPPGSVYIMEYFDVFVTVDTDGSHSSKQQAQRVILRQCDSVEERFREPLFSKTMLNDHLPSHYERSTQLLYEGLGQGLL